MNEKYFLYGLILVLTVLSFVVGGIAVSQEKEVQILRVENQTYKEEFIEVVDEIAKLQAQIDYIQIVEEINKQLIQEGMFITFDGEVFYYVQD
jgi:hypothetical protein